MRRAAAPSASTGHWASTTFTDRSPANPGRFAASALAIVMFISVLGGCQSANQRTAAELMDQRAAATSSGTTEDASSMSGDDAPSELAFEEPTAQPSPTAFATAAPAPTAKPDDTIGYTPSEKVADPRHSPLTVHSAPATAYSVVHTFPAAGKVTLTGRIETTDTGLWVEVDLFPLEYNGWVPQVAVLDPDDPILGLWTEEELEAITQGNVGTGEELVAPIPFPAEATEG